MTYSTRNRVSDANDVLGLRCSGRLLAWILLLASSVFLSNASPIERDGVGSEGARDCSANSLLALTLRNAHWKLRDFSQNPVPGCGGSAEQRGAGPLSQRLRGGRGQGEREFVGEGGKTIKLNADGEVVASDIKSVKVTKDKRWTEKRLQGELRRETKRAALAHMAEGAVLEIPGGSDRIVREDAAFRDNLRISLSVPERESSPTHVARQMRQVSRRKGKRTKKHVPMRQQRAEERGLAARAGRGERAAMAELKRNHVHAALQHVAEEIAGTPAEKAKLVREQRQRGVRPVSSWTPGGKDLLDGGSGDFARETVAIEQIMQEVHATWRESQAKQAKQDAEKWAYITSKDYLKKKKAEETKTKRIVAAKKRLEKAKSSNRRKKQDKRLGVDRTVVNLDSARRQPRADGGGRVKAPSRGGGGGRKEQGRKGSKVTSP